MMTNDSSPKDFLLGWWKLMANKLRQVTFSLSLKITYNFGDQLSRKSKTAFINSPPTCLPLFPTISPTPSPQHYPCPTPTPTAATTLAVAQITHRQRVVDTDKTYSLWIQMNVQQKRSEEVFVKNSLALVRFPKVPKKRFWEWGCGNTIWWVCMHHGYSAYFRIFVFHWHAFSQLLLLRYNLPLSCHISFHVATLQRHCGGQHLSQFLKSKSNLKTTEYSLDCGWLQLNFLEHQNLIKSSH